MPMQAIKFKHEPLIEVLLTKGVIAGEVVGLYDARWKRPPQCCIYEAEGLLPIRRSITGGRLSWEDEAEQML